MSAVPWSDGAEGLEQPIVSAVTHSENEVVFDLTGLPDRPGIAAAIFEAVAAEGANVDTILQDVVHGSATVSFSVPTEDVDATRRALEHAHDTIGPVRGDRDQRSRQGRTRRGRDALSPRRDGTDVPNPRGRGDQPADDLDVADHDLVPHPPPRPRAGRRVAAGRLRPRVRLSRRRRRRPSRRPPAPRATRCARFTALRTARSDAVTIDGWIPTPQTTSPETSAST